MSAAGPHGLAVAVGHFCLFTSEAALVGVLVVSVLVLRPALCGATEGPPIVRTMVAARLALVLDVSLAVAAAATLGLLLAQAGLLTRLEGTGLGTGSLPVVLDTHVGQWEVLRLGLLAALALVLHGRVARGLLAVGGETRLPRLWWSSWTGLSVGLLVSVSLTGHAGTAGPLIVLADAIHLAAGAAWLAGVAVLAAVLPASLAGLRPIDQERVLSRTVGAFSRLALVAVPVVAVTGTLNALMDVSRLNDLRVTGYGQALAMKLWLFAWVLAFGGVNHYRLRHRLAGSHGAVATTRARQVLSLTVTGELLFGLLVVAATSLLVGLPKTG